MEQFSKQYYSISEVAEIFKVKTSKLRYWETQFPHLMPKRRSSGIRKYTPEDIEKIKVLIQLIEEKGLTIEGAKQAINHRGEAKNINTPLINQLTEIRQFLQGLREDLGE
ncbi:MerR family transcriptional regulator [Aquirufa nivalisilvae]|uniref:MerR family transcriptional regulator n=1 Tax=Aquirufa nivalisilvae TaxID=2516557 RepID=UPI001032EF93|nr:MerR family transcriptional regulator [Aquirufa nivalisilvae]MCZ2482202.1 MerR family transcriptional regulator [Aquirufa nivalisilvae]TBH73595.1 MerR family transcriptional regulator [Aquirufa nivalisilvae]